MAGRLTLMAFAGKKLKRRLEDLERRAGSSDEAEPEKKRTPSPGKSSKRQAATKAQKPQAQATPAKPMSRGQFTPPMESADELIFTTPVYGERERSRTPPVFSYTPYPAPDELLLDPYASAQPYPTMSTAGDPYPNYLTASTMSSSLPSMTHFSEAMKRDSFPSDDGMSSYLSYGGFMPGVEISMPSPYDTSNPHVSFARHRQLPHRRDVSC